MNKNILDLPTSILETLWFADGPHANYVESNLNKNLFGLNIHTSTSKEPSLIYTELPIKIVPINAISQDLGYYPTFERLSAEQRYLYLRWLTDRTISVSNSFIYLYYYGLERHLYFGNAESAILEIFNLCLNHKSTLDYYALNAILASSIIMNKRERLLYLFKDKDRFKKFNITNFYILCKKEILPYLAPRDLLALSLRVKLKAPHVDEKILIKSIANTLEKKFSMSKLPLDIFDFNSFPCEPICLAANTSLNLHQYSPILAAPLKSDDFCDSVRDILYESFALTVNS
ncbi:TerB N-terminal domain-containing protein [Holdemania massiliensis]|uniref:TerB N-terminal domain-containing protein n=1 Tax=Holdemania massiliensis TaxID=1468449 RepID=UPI001F0644D0|nr:TerB N-terminal domain-containing protein [Holdemania massiliensis]MCH1940494.1 TerB N-terminal domain-containing protein [Holdemania massiliensis]